MADAVEFDQRQLESILKKIAAPMPAVNRRKAMRKSLFRLRRVVAKYPPATEANREPPEGSKRRSWYERGFGTRTVTGKAYPTSETLGRRWTSAKADVRQDGGRGTIGNNASYAKYVQDKDTQAGFHKDRGWVTIQDAIEDNQRVIIGFWKDEADKALSRP